MPKTLLVVDDSATIREAARLALTGEGWSVIEAAASDEALAVIRSERLDAILCDVSLGEEDGYELCRTIRLLPEGAGVPVVLMGSKVSSAAAKAAGALGSLPKPFASDELADALRSALGTGSFERELSEPETDGAPQPAGNGGDEGATSEEDELEIIDLSSDEEYEELELLEDLEPVALAPARPAPAEASERALADLENFPGLPDEAVETRFSAPGLPLDEATEREEASPEGPLASASVPREPSLDADAPDLDLSPSEDEAEAALEAFRAQPGAEDAAESWLPGDLTAAPAFDWEESPLPGSEPPVDEPAEVPGSGNFFAVPSGPDERASAERAEEGTGFPEAPERPSPAVPDPELLADSISKAAAQAVRAALDNSLSAERLLPAVEAVVERVVWEVVPPLAERLIQEAIEKLRQEPPAL